MYAWILKINLECSCNKYSNLIGQLKVQYISLIDLLSDLILIGLILGCQGQRKMHSQCNSSLVPRPNVMVTVAIAILNQLETSSSDLYTF